MPNQYETNNACGCTTTPDVPVTVDGGTGNDTLITGLVNDTINGGFGSDYMDGGAGTGPRRLLLARVL